MDSFEEKSIMREFSRVEKFFHDAEIDLEDDGNGKYRLVSSDMYIKTDWYYADEMRAILIGMRYAVMFTKCVGIR